MFFICSFIVLMRAQFHLHNRTECLFCITFWEHFYGDSVPNNTFVWICASMKRRFSSCLLAEKWWTNCSGPCLFNYQVCCFYLKLDTDLICSGQSQEKSCSSHLTWCPLHSSDQNSSKTSIYNPLSSNSQQNDVDGKCVHVVAIIEGRLDIYVFR